MIRNILFDLGNVLVPVDRSIAYGRLGPYLPPEKKRLLTEDLPAFERLLQEPVQALETGRIDFARFRLETSDILGIRVGADAFHRIWCDMFQLDHGMIAFNGPKKCSVVNCPMAWISPLCSACRIPRVHCSEPCRASHSTALLSK